MWDQIKMIIDKGLIKYKTFENFTSEMTSNCILEWTLKQDLSEFLERIEKRKVSVNEEEAEILEVTVFYQNTLYFSFT